MLCQKYTKQLMKKQLVQYRKYLEETKFEKLILLLSYDYKNIKYIYEKLYRIDVASLTTKEQLEEVGVKMDTILKTILNKNSPDLNSEPEILNEIRKMKLETLIKKNNKT